MVDRTPTPRELSTWRSFLRAHARLTRVLESELVRSQDLSLACYDVLVQLAEAPDRRLRMTDLADLVLLSRSGITRLVARMEADGLVRRDRAAGDGRGVVASLTEAGLSRLRAASTTHLDGITRHFADPLRDVDIDGLRRLTDRLAGPSVNPARPADPMPSTRTPRAPVRLDPGHRPVARPVG